MIKWSPPIVQSPSQPFLGMSRMEEASLRDIPKTAAKETSCTVVLNVYSCATNAGTI